MPIELIIDAVKIAANPSGYLINKIVENAAQRASRADGGAEDLPTLREEAERRELETRINQAEARVAQEVAIAKRIETAEEVEIEEFYDSSAGGNIGGSYDGATVSLGAGGSGRRVSKRVYRFRGNTASVSPDVPEPDKSPKSA